MSTVSEIIVIAAPFVFGFTCWLLHEVYASFKGDLGELKKSNSLIRTDVAKQAVQIANLDQKVTTVSQSVDAIRKTTHELDKRTGDTVEMTHAIKNLEKNLTDHKAEFGKVLLILKKVVHIVTSRKE